MGPPSEFAMIGRDDWIEPVDESPVGSTKSIDRAVLSLTHLPRRQRAATIVLPGSIRKVSTLAAANENFMQLIDGGISVRIDRD